MLRDVNVCVLIFEKAIGKEARIFVSNNASFLNSSEKASAATVFQASEARRGSSTSSERRARQQQIKRARQQQVSFDLLISRSLLPSGRSLGSSTASEPGQ